MVMDLVVIHSKDTTQWKDYIRSYLGKEVFNKKILDKRDVDLLDPDPATQSEISRAKALIVVASPLHLLFLVEFSGFSYARFVTDVSRAQLLLCGVNVADFNGVDTNGVPISRRFPNFSDWKKLSHDRHGDLLRNAMVLMEAEEDQRTSKHGKSGSKRRRKKEFQITPAHVKYKASRRVIIITLSILYCIGSFRFSKGDLALHANSSTQSMLFSLH